MKNRNRKIRAIVVAYFVILLLGVGVEKTASYFTDESEVGSFAIRLVAEDPMATNLNFQWQVKDKKVRFILDGGGVRNFDSVDWEVSYQSDSGPQLILGQEDLKNKQKLVVNNIEIGSCSSNGVCVDDEVTGKIKLKVILNGVITRTLEAEI